MKNSDRPRILITGGSGFIGTNAVQHWRALDYEVLSIDIRQPRDPAHRDCWVQCDVTDGARMRQEFRTFDPHYLLHLAARTDLDEKQNLDGYAVNIDGVSNVVELAAASPGLRCAIFASSRMVCRIGYQPHHDGDYNPPNLYGESKVRGEQIVRAAGLQCKSVVVRPASIWGPWFDVPYRIFFDLVRQGWYVNPAGLNPIKSFGFVGNTIDQLHKILEASPELVNRKTIYLCDYPPLRVREWAELIRRALGAPRVRSVPFGLLRAAALAGDVLDKAGLNRVPLTTFRLNNLITDMTFDTGLLERICGPPRYSLSEGVRLTAEWMLRQPSQQ